MASFNYDHRTHVDPAGRRWHFASHHPDYEQGTPYEEQPWELLFRDEDYQEFGRIRFERRKDNPYRDYDTLVRKILQNSTFRNTLLDQTVKSIWRRSWK